MVKALSKKRRDAGTPTARAPRINLFAQAQLNIERVERQYLEAISENPAVADFETCIAEHARVSINRGQSPVVELFESNRFLSGYRYAENIGIDFRILLREGFEWPDELVSRRMRIVELFEDGEDHLFGALNLNGPGTIARNAAYGYYCIVLKNEVIGCCSRTAFCRNDGLRGPYWNETNDLIRDAYYADLAPYSHSAKLAAIKHRSDIKSGMDRREYAAVLIGERRTAAGTADTEDYIEVCFVESIKRTSVEQVRIHPGIAPSILIEVLMDSEPNRLRSGYTFSQHAKIAFLLCKYGIPLV